MHLVEKWRRKVLELKQKSKSHSKQRTHLPSSPIGGGGGEGRQAGEITINTCLTPERTHTPITTGDLGKRKCYVNRRQEGSPSRSRTERMKI